jgi:hypothetical protein
MMFRDARKGQFEWRNTIAPLLGEWVVLLAMKHRRAPLPVSSALWKGLLRNGFLNDLGELALFARRFLFLGDASMLLAELRIRTTTNPPVRETLSEEEKVAAEYRPQIAADAGGPLCRETVHVAGRTGQSCANRRTHRLLLPSRLYGPDRPLLKTETNT